MKFCAINHQKVKTISLKLLCNEYLSLFCCKNIFFVYHYGACVRNNSNRRGVEHCVCSVKIYYKK